MERSLENFPVVGLVGSRQSGKTTLARTITKRRSKDDILYLDLERSSDLAKLGDAELFLERFKDRLIVIDEIQRRPELFPSVRVMVDEQPGQAGRFLILGSASPQLVRQSSESLAGRIVYHELSPFTADEIDPALSGRLWCRGGYPPSFLARSDGQSLRWREAFISTYLERDIPGLGLTLPASLLRRFWEMVAHSHGQLLNSSKIGASLGVSAPTVKRYLDLLQDTFIARQLQPYHPNIKKRLVKSSKVYMRDSGLLHALLRIPNEDVLIGTPHAGASFEGWVIEQILAILPPAWQAYFYRTGAGAEMDLVLVRPGSEPVGIEIKLTKSPSIGKGFRQSMSDLGCRQAFIICPANEAFPLAPQVEVLPVAELGKLTGFLFSLS